MEFDFVETVEDISKVPDQFKPLYEQGEDGKYTIAADDRIKGMHGALFGLNTALKAARGEAKNLRGQKVDLSPLAEFGEDPATIASTFQAKLDELNTALQEGKKINPDKIRADLQKGFDAEREKITKRNEALTNQLHTLMVDNAATSAIVELKGVPELLLPFVRQQVKVVEEDGQLAVTVVDGQGDTRYSSATGKPMTIKELVTTMKADQKYGRLFESEALDGGGFPPNGGQRRTPIQQGDKTAQDKIRDGMRRRMQGRMR